MQPRSGQGEIDAHRGRRVGALTPQYPPPVQAGGGHVITLGSSKATTWQGDVDDFAREIHRQARRWECSDAQRRQWLDEYQELDHLIRARIQAWAGVLAGTH